MISVHSGSSSSVEKKTRFRIYHRSEKVTTEKRKKMATSSDKGEESETDQMCGNGKCRHKNVRALPSL